MMKKTLLHIFFMGPFFCLAQNDSTTTIDTKVAKKTPHYASRKWLAGAGSAVAAGGSFIFLNEAWYKGYPRSDFHTFNDNREWLQMDKVGHVWTAYTLNHLITRSWQWAGVDHKNAVWMGTGTSLLYMLSIEYLDGRSAQWGWSWGDATADVIGNAVFAIEDLAWKDQRIQIKFSPGYHQYKEPDLKQRADQLFGKSLPERILKDYNAQRYYLSINLKSFFQNSKLPPWLNVAVAYGAEGMYGAFENIAYDANGNITFDRRDIKRYRQWYLMPDFDLSKIKTKSKFLKTLFEVFYFTVPFPSLEYSQGKVRFNLITSN